MNEERKDESKEGLRCDGKREKAGVGKGITEVKQNKGKEVVSDLKE